MGLVLSAATPLLLKAIGGSPGNAGPTLKFAVAMDLPSKIGFAGSLLVMISLVLPSVKHGSPMLGLQCAGLAAVVAVTPGPEYDPDPSDVIYCRIAWLANLFAMVVMVISLLDEKTFQSGTIGAFVVLLLCLFFLLMKDHPGVSERYVGYYLWLAGLLLMGCSGVVRVIENKQSIFGSANQ
ncbi:MULTISPECIES: hypothetical protein [Pirellulaceae]|uniref:hypothetical protein n=1 Tax=Pirellulaceae TaxID=2691357 RepID=UPI0011B01E1C|nr:MULTISPECIES: hypothetical protein [Pirellulaceae]